MVAQDKQQPVDQRVNSIRKVMIANRERLGQAIAGLLSPDRMISIACNSIRKNPKLLDCTPASLFAAISEAGTYGWVCDGITGQASMVPFWNSRKRTFEVVLIPGYKGLRDLVRRSGECDVSMESVHEGDSYEYLGRFSEPKHTYSDHDDRRFRPVTHAYVVGRFRSGNLVCFSWRVGECIAHRDRYSQGWRRVKDDPAKAKESPWDVEHPSFRVMCMKTVLLDAIHRGEFPLSVEQQDVARRELDIAAQEAQTVDAEDFSVIEDPPAIEGPTDDENTVDAATVDVDQGEAPDDSDQSSHFMDEVITKFKEFEQKGDCDKYAAELKASGNLSDDQVRIVDDVCAERKAQIGNSRGSRSKPKQKNLQEQEA